MVLINSSRLKIYSLALLTLTAVLIAGGFSSSMGQWSNDPAKNTRLVIDAADPIDISAVEDLRGGAFIFWQDNKDRFQGKVYFMHVDADGKISFRADGKQVSGLPVSSENPVCCGSLPNSAAVVWKDIEAGGLYAQRVQENGSLLWSENGVRVTSKDIVNDYTAASDNKGSCIISYITKPSDLNGFYSLKVQKISADGKKLFKSDSALVYKSVNRLSMPRVSAYNGGAFIFWLENKLNKQGKWRNTQYLILLVLIPIAGFVFIAQGTSVEKVIGIFTGVLALFSGVMRLMDSSTFKHTAT